MRSNGALILFFFLLMSLLLGGSTIPISKRLIENQTIGRLEYGALAFTVIYDDPSWFWARPFIQSLPGPSIIVLVTDTRTGTVKQIPCRRIGTTILCE